MKTIYVDAAASALKPKSVMARESEFLKHEYANAGRGICPRATHVDDMIFAARNRVREFINAAALDSVIFTSGTTDGINKIAAMLDRGILNPESVVIVSDLDHHSARLPFEDLAKRGRCKIWVCPLTDDFEMDTDALRQKCANGDVAVVIISAMSNVLGVRADVKKIVSATRAFGHRPITIADSAQSAAHSFIDVSDWDIDACVFSGHKVGADTGIGIMYLKNPDRWTPSNYGGGMVVAVFNGPHELGHSDWTLAHGPSKFEAGTLSLTQIAGLPAALDELSMRDLKKHRRLLDFLYRSLSKNPRINIISKKSAEFLTFRVTDMHPMDFGAMMGANNVCLRVGNMCASWLHSRLGAPAGTIRISPGPWNTRAEMAQIIDIINGIIK